MTTKVDDGGAGLRERIQDAVCPPSEHPQFGTMRLGDDVGLYQTGEFQIAGDFTHAINRLVTLFNSEQSQLIDRLVEAAVFVTYKADGGHGRAVPVDILLNIKKEG